MQSLQLHRCIGIAMVCTQADTDGIGGIRRGGLTLKGGGQFGDGLPRLLDLVVRLVGVEHGLHPRQTGDGQDGDDAQCDGELHHRITPLSAQAVGR